MWTRDNTAVMTAAEFTEAAERGRLMAARALTVDPEARYRVESKYGKQFCIDRWPEAYGRENLGGYMSAFKRAVQAAKSLLPILLVCVLLASLAYADSSNAGAFRAPSIYKGAVATNVYWTAGTINNGGDSLAVTAGSHALTANQNNCAAPAFSACNILYADSAGAVDLTQTLSTAVAAGNTLLAFIETGAADAILTNLVLPPQSGTLWLQAAGPNMGAVTVVTPAAAGSAPLGSAALPFSGAYIGDAATNNFLISGTATGARAINLADSAGTLMLTALATNAPGVANSVTGISNGLAFEGATGGDGFQLMLAPTDPTADVTATFPNASFNVGEYTVSWAQGATVANAVSSQFFIADRNVTVTEINVVWGTAETTGAMDVMVERLQGTEACGAGDDLQNAVVDATGAANTVATPALTGTPALLNLAAGNRLCVTLTATPNEVANLVVTVTLQPAQ